MAQVTVKLFGNLRMDTHIPKMETTAQTLDQIFDQLGISFGDAIVYIDGKRITKKHRRLTDGEEIWLMSPASGG